MLEVQELSKSFAGQEALTRLSFSLPKAAIFGLLGPNGSGKTTTVRLLNGLLKPDHGQATLQERRIGPDQPDLRRLCGVMTDGANLYDQLNGRQNLEFFADLFSLPDAKRRSAELLEMFNLAEAAERKVRTYSTGMRKRLMLARALLHRPIMLFLDEPTSGLDPESALEVNQLIKRLAYEDQVTILLCTHQLKYAEGLCSHYGFLERGVMRAVGTWEELLQRAGRPRYLELRGENLNHPELEHTLDGRLRLRIADDAAAAAALNTLIRQGASLYEAHQTSLSLEDLYFAIIGEAKNDAKGVAQ